MPYGETRGTQPTWLGTKGYVGGTKDATTGLTHLGAREYDPTTGRFISIDPEIDHLEPQTLHGYLYSNNNPATYSDPTGRNWFTSGVKGFGNGLWDSTIGAVVSMAQTVKTETERGFERLDAIQSGEMTYMQAVQDTIDNSMSKAPHPLTGLVATVGLVEQGVNAQQALFAGDFDAAAEGYGYLGGVGGGTYAVGRGIGGARGGWNARNGRLLGEAEAARDALAAEISENGRPHGANTPASGKSTVVGAYNPLTGRVVAGLNSCPIYCAEYGAMHQLGVPWFLQRSLLRFTGAVIEGKKPGQWKPMPVCHYCQTWTKPHQYAPGTRFKPGGAWDGLGGV